MQPSPPTEDQIPSLGVIEAALEREDGYYRDRANGMDGKAAAILGAAGVIVALIGTTPNIAALVGQALAITAGAVAAGVLVPHIDRAIAPGDLRDRYLAAPVALTRMVLLNSRITAHAENEARLVTRARPLRSASLLLLGSTAIILMSGMLRAAR